MPVINLHQNQSLKSLSQRNWPNGFVYIGRAGRGLTGTFGNPVKVCEECLVCRSIHKKPVDTLKCYRQWLEQEIRTNYEFREFVKQLAKKTLVCFCHPRPCHGDILEEIANRLAVIDTPEGKP